MKSVVEFQRDSSFRADPKRYKILTIILIFNSFTLAEMVT